MIRWECDYAEGCHPDLLAALARTNWEQTPGYGVDAHCERARGLIRDLCQAPEAAVEFLVGGTQTNTTVIAAALRPHQGVLCAHTGHINCHETGAIESTGHKVLPLPSADGKISAAQVEQAVKAHWQDPTHEHMVQPGMVYISHPTEFGTLYTKSELEGLKAVCADYGLKLFLDGARLGYGLAAKGTDVTLEVLARCCDVFYIGGTKVGALFGEAVVFPKKGTAPGFFTLVKQQGALLAKGRLLGIQFDTLFTDGLYFKISAHAIEMAERLKGILDRAGCSFWLDSPTNQQFVVLGKEQRKALEGKVSYEPWEELGDGKLAVRFATSWATRREDLDRLEEILETI